MTRPTGQRQYRACVRCRTRKTRCDLQTIGEPGQPPCAKCHREGAGAECTLAGSKRGGDYSHLRRTRTSTRKLNKENNHQPEVADSIAVSANIIVYDGDGDDDASLLSCPPAGTGVTTHNVNGQGAHVHHDSLQNPTDALLILAHAGCCHAAEGDPSSRSSGGGDDPLPKGSLSQDDTPSTTDAVQPRYLLQEPSSLAIHGNTGSAAQQGHGNINMSAASYSYEPLKAGLLHLALLEHLLQHYAVTYHPFFPIVHPTLLTPSHLPGTIKHESFLLTALLVVASRDRPDLVDLHKGLWEYMRRLILDVVLGMPNIKTVGCVEGLLLLSEWTPLRPGQVDDGGEGAAWSILGLAVRLAYMLHLEESSFRSNEKDKAKDAMVMQRERLAWTFTYLSDRQISIRMGQAFWCRGPALSARFTADDFPSLQPKHSYEEDFASLLQAQVELTTLFGNAHDILFASRQRTTELMVRGDYNKYIDDTRRALAAWEQIWRDLVVSQHLKCCLSLMKQYLRLYVNAFAFQAVLYRSSSSAGNVVGINGVVADTQSSFPASTMASPDAPHVYEAIEAAKTLLKIIVEDIDPEKHLRYMPARFYLYEIHSAVFLYKAHSTGAISSVDHSHVSSLVRRYITILNAAATDSEHIAARHAKLLNRLWFYRTAITTITAEPPQPQNIINGAVTYDAEPTEISGGLSIPVGPSDMDVPPLFDGLGLHQFECADVVDGLFSMPTAFPWD